MLFRDANLAAAIRRIAEQRIEEAMRQGKFNNLPGAGKPIDLESLEKDPRLSELPLPVRFSHGK